MSIYNNVGKGESHHVLPTDAGDVIVWPNYLLQDVLGYSNVKGTLDV